MRNYMDNNPLIVLLWNWYFSEFQFFSLQATTCLIHFRRFGLFLNTKSSNFHTNCLIDCSFPRFFNHLCQIYPTIDLFSGLEHFVNLRSVNLPRLIITIQGGQ